MISTMSPFQSARTGEWFVRLIYREPSSEPSKDGDSVIILPISHLSPERYARYEALITDWIADVQSELRPKLTRLLDQLFAHEVRTLIVEIKDLKDDEIYLRSALSALERHGKEAQP